MLNDVSNGAAKPRNEREGSLSSAASTAFIQYEARIKNLLAKTFRL